MGKPALDDSIRASAENGGANFRLAMREFASGVSIVAAGAGDGRAGCTATALASLSLTPPSLVVCLNRTTATLAAARLAGAFSVNILADRHQFLAERFAGIGGVEGAARFDEGGWVELVTGSPTLADALAAMDCRVEEIIERHTHAILIGEVVGVRMFGAPGALLHWRSHFETLA